MNTKKARTILINEIEMVNHKRFILWGFIPDETLEPKAIVITRAAFYELMQLNSSKGKEILSIVAQTFSTPHTAPFHIFLTDLFGTTQELTLPAHYHISQGHHTDNHTPVYVVSNIA